MGRQGKSGVSPRSIQNLKRGNPEHAFTVRNASEMAQRAAEARRQYRAIREVARELLTEEVMTAIIQALIEQAEAGNVRAFEVLRDTVDGKPVQGLNLTNESSGFDVRIQVVDSSGNVQSDTEAEQYIREISG